MSAPVFGELRPILSTLGEKADGYKQELDQKFSDDQEWLVELVGQTSKEIRNKM